MKAFVNAHTERVQSMINKTNEMSKIYETMGRDVQKQLGAMTEMLRTVIDVFNPILGDYSFFEMFNCGFVKEDLIYFFEMFFFHFAKSSITVGSLCLGCAFISYLGVFFLIEAIYKNSDMVGFNIDELHYIGLMARFHHKKFPGAKDRRLADIPPEDALCIRQCSMFLKMGDVLDRHRNATVRNIRLTLRKGEIVIGVECDGDPSMEFWRLDKVRGDFRKLFGLELEPVVIDGVQPSIARRTASETVKPR